MSNGPAETSAAPRKGHPPGLYVLFFAELWERFSFYGMRSLLTLYMTKVLKYADQKAYGVYGAYGALVYATPVPGGLLADRLLGYRLAILIGGLLMALGHFVMAIPNEMAMYVALALICVGNGLFKPNISSLVGSLYPEGDPRRDAGFTIFYMGINVGAALAPLLCGWLGQQVGWHYGFGLAGVGMLGGLAWFVKGGYKLEGQGAPPSAERLHRPLFAGLSGLHLTVVGALLLAPIIALGMWRNTYVGVVLYALAIAVFGGLLMIGGRRGSVVLQRLIVAVILMAASTVFWALFEQAGSSLTLFTDRNVDLVVDKTLKASTLLAVNPIFIILFATPFAAMWTKLKRTGHDPSIPLKFSFGLAQLGLGFLVLILGTTMAKEGLVGITWLLLMYFLHTTGELCLSPVGLSAMTKLAPKEAVGTVMGAWFLSASFSHHIGGVIAKLTSLPPGAHQLGPTESLPVYAGVFSNLGYLAVGIGVFVAIVTPLLKRMMHGVN